jgi:hypothetical protein
LLMQAICTRAVFSTSGVVTTLDPIPGMGISRLGQDCEPFEVRTCATRRTKPQLTVPAPIEGTAMLCKLLL